VPAGTQAASSPAVPAAKAAPRNALTVLVQASRGRPGSRCGHTCTCAESCARARCVRRFVLGPTPCILWSSPALTGVSSHTGQGSWRKRDGSIAMLCVRPSADAVASDLRREQTLFAALHADAASPSDGASGITMTPSAFGAQRVLDLGDAGRTLKAARLASRVRTSLDIYPCFRWFRRLKASAGGRLAVGVHAGQYLTRRYRAAGAAHPAATAGS